MEREIKGQSLNLDNLLKKLFNGNLGDLNSTHQEHLKKPYSYHIWIEITSKLNFEDARNIALKLYEYGFCNLVEIESIGNDLFRYQKAKIAILPKNYINNFIDDMKELWPTKEINFTLSEFTE